MRNRLALMSAILALMVIPWWMAPNHAEQQRITAPSPPPVESYSHAPAVPFDRSDYVIKINQMSSFYDKPGEFGYAIHGEEYGFDRLSFVLTETQPNGGPPLHTHTVEEAHVVFSGRVSYIIGDRRLTAEGPVRGARASGCASHVRQLGIRADQRRRRVSEQAARLHRGGAEPAGETAVTRVRRFNDEARQPVPSRRNASP